MPNTQTDLSANGQMTFSGAMYTFAAPQVAVGALLGSFVVCGDLPPIASGASTQDAGIEQLALAFPTPAEASDFLDFNHQLQPTGRVAVRAISGNLPNQDWDY